MGVSGSDTGNWRAYHEMLANQVVAGPALAGELEPGWPRSGGTALAGSPFGGRVVDAGAGIVVLYAVGAYVSSTPQYPWWTLGGLVAAVLLSVGLAGWTFWRATLSSRPCL